MTFPREVDEYDQYEVASSVGDAERDLHSEFDENDARWDDWEEEEVAAVCPFCLAAVGPAAAAFDHCVLEHAFDFRVVRKELDLDFYGCIRLVNYVRVQTRENPGLTGKAVIAAGKAAAWIADDALLQPVVEDDPLLYAFEDDEDDAALLLASAQPSFTPPTSETESLLQRLKIAEGRAALAERRLAELQVAFLQYKDVVKTTFFDKHVPQKPKMQKAEDRGAEEVEDDEWQMDYYFGSYAETEIHESMLKDTVRTESYRDFVYHNKDYFKGKVVLDVGCGTGILSMFAAKAGASKVFAVDNSTIIKKARKITAENGLENIITFIQGKVEDIQLPVDNVDIIISEWMGYFLLFEGMLDSVLVARDRWLAPDGIMAPSRSTIVIAAIHDEDWINDKYHFWNDVYGFKMQTMKHGFLRDAQVDHTDAKLVISNKVIVKDIDISTTTVPLLDFTTPFRLVCTRTGRINGICGWFDIVFDGRDEDTGRELSVVEFSTGPDVKSTHWKQTTFALEQGIDCVEGTVIEGTFKCVKSEENHRELVVDLEFVVTDPNGAHEPVSIKRNYQVR